MEKHREAAILSHLSGAVAIPTVSAPNAPTELVRFTDLHRFFEESYPLVHNTLTRETVLENSLLYRWQGSDSSLAPFGLLGHMDVVPVEAGTEGDWTYPPFSGHNDGTHIFGRGANDMKNHVIALFEAIESLLEQGYAPKRDIYLMLGHNEEILAGGDESGARRMAEILKSRNVRLAFVLDEGGAVMTSEFMGVKKPIAALGIAEKGYLDLLLTVSGPGGHAAEPPADTAVFALARLLSALEKDLPKPRLLNTVAGTFKVLSKELGGALGFVLSHPKGFFPLIRRATSGNSQMLAMLRTTCVATMLQAGSQANVLPQTAEATLNIRLLPGDTDEKIIAWIQKTAVRKKINCSVSVLNYSAPPSETDKESPVFARLAALTEKHHGALPLPYLVTGSTDSREYADVADEIFRFYPFALDFDELGSMHSTDERIKCSSVIEAVAFMEEFIRLSDEYGLEATK